MTATTTGKEKLFRFAALALVLFALLFRIGYQTTAEVDSPLRADASQYTFIAWNMLNHGMVSMAAPGTPNPQPDSYRGPGYPALIASAILLGGEDHWYFPLLIMQAVLGALSVLLAMLIVRRWLPWGYTLLVGGLVAVWPHLVTLTGYVLTETFFGFSMLLAIWLLCRAQDRQRAYLYVLAGLVFGVSALINPVILVFPLLAAAVLFFSNRRLASIFLVCALLLPVAWSIRGMTLDVERKASSSGRLMENVLIGLEPDFDSYYHQDPRGWEANQRVQAALALYRRDPPAAYAAIGQRLASDPGFYLKWYVLEKPLRFWSWSIGQGAGDIYVYPTTMSPFETKPLYRIVAAVCHGMNTVLMLLAFAATVLLLAKAMKRRLGREDLPLAWVTLLFVYATAIHSALAPDVRYSTPFRPTEIILAVTCLAMLQQEIRSARVRTAAATPAAE
jgi:4-amino-4-deoxy-L-arabinose transferase-like glycosyltransferase